MKVSVHIAKNANFHPHSSLRGEVIKTDDVAGISTHDNRRSNLPSLIDRREFFITSIKTLHSRSEQGDCFVDLVTMN